MLCNPKSWSAQPIKPLMCVQAVLTTRKAGKKLGVFDLVVELAWEGTWALDNTASSPPPAAGCTLCSVPLCD